MRQPALSGSGKLRRELSFAVGGISIRLRARSESLHLHLPPGLEAFTAEASPRAMDVSVDLADLSASALGRKVFDSGGLWQLYDDGAHCSYRFESAARGPAPYRIARFSRDFSAGEVLQHPHREARAGLSFYPLEYPLDELLVIRRLGLEGGVELHACGVIAEDERGFLFVGQSGAGKTTTARLWDAAAPCTVLSDDRIILRREAGAFRMYGTPWHGEARYASPRSAPLANVFLLDRAPKNRIDPIPRAEATARLLACSFVPFHDAAAVDSAARLLEEIVHSIPCHRLAFVPDPSVVPYVRLGL